MSVSAIGERTDDVSEGVPLPRPPRVSLPKGTEREHMISQHFFPTRENEKSHLLVPSYSSGVKNLHLLEHTFAIMSMAVPKLTYITTQEFFAIVFSGLSNVVDEVLDVVANGTEFVDYVVDQWNTRGKSKRGFRGGGPAVVRRGASAATSSGAISQASAAGARGAVAGAADRTIGLAQKTGSTSTSSGSNKKTTKSHHRHGHHSESHHHHEHIRIRETTDVYTSSGGHVEHHEATTIVDETDGVVTNRTTASVDRIFDPADLKIPGVSSATSHFLKKGVRTSVGIVNKNPCSATFVEDTVLKRLLECLWHVALTIGYWYRLDKCSLEEYRCLCVGLLHFVERLHTVSEFLPHDVLPRGMFGAFSTGGGARHHRDW